MQSDLLLFKKSAADNRNFYRDCPDIARANSLDD